MENIKKAAITCNACGEVFTISDIIVIKDGDIHFHFLRCPHCETAFLISVSDRELRRRVRLLRCGQKQRTATNKSVSLHYSQQLKEQHRGRFAELVPKAWPE